MIIAEIAETRRRFFSAVLCNQRANMHIGKR